MKVYSIIVCYNPDVPNLLQICRKLLSSRSSVIIVDNTSKSYLTELNDLPDCSLISLGENTGIAHAQNIGIKHAIKCGADMVVFFDQDSKIENGFLTTLLGPLKPGIPGVVAPVFYDNTKGYEFPSMRLNKYGLLVKVYKQNRCIPYNVDVITSSGSAATVATFYMAGFMDEDFFIDFVETEWCLRCRNKKIPIQVVPAAMMKHSIGEKSINLGVIRVFVHNPERCYYQIRNSLLLLRKKDIPFLLKFKEILSTFIHRVIMLVFVSNRWDYLKNYYIAVLHGFRGTVGNKPA